MSNYRSHLSFGQYNNIHYFGLKNYKGFYIYFLIKNYILYPFISNFQYYKNTHTLEDMIKSLLRSTLQQTNNFYNPRSQTIKVTLIFMVLSRVTSGIYLHNNRVRFNFSLEEKVHDYIRNIEHLSLNEHIQYFHQFLKSPKQVQMDSAYWVLMTNKLLPMFKQISQNDKNQMLQKLSLIKKQCQLKEQLKKSLFSFTKLQITGLHRMLYQLNRQKQSNASALKQKYEQVYGYLFQIFYFFINQQFKSMSQDQKVKYLKQFKLSFVKDQKQRKTIFSNKLRQNNTFYIDVKFYRDFCKQLNISKAENIQYKWFNYWIFTSPFIGNHNRGNKNLNRLQLQTCRTIFYYYYELHRSILKDNFMMVNDFSLRMMEHILEQQKQEIQLPTNRGQIFFYFYQKVTRFIIALSKAKNKEILSEQKKSYCEDIQKRATQYIFRAFQKIHKEKQILLKGNQRNLRSLFEMLPQLLNIQSSDEIVEISTYLNLLQYFFTQSQLRQIKPHFLSRHVRAVHVKQLLKKDRLSLLPFQKEMWNLIWEKYPFMLKEDKLYVNKIVQHSRQNEPEQFEVKVPSNIHLNEENSFSYNKTKK